MSLPPPLALELPAALRGDGGRRRPKTRRSTAAAAAAAAEAEVEVGVETIVDAAAEEAGAAEEAA